MYDKNGYKVDPQSGALIVEFLVGGRSTGREGILVELGIADDAGGLDAALVEYEGRVIKIHASEIAPIQDVDRVR